MADGPIRMVSAQLYVLLLALAPWLLISRADPVSQFEFNCPKSCACNKTTIVCQNGSYDDTTVFLAINDKFYPDLDTLIISGNRFSEMESPNLFGPEVKHQRLSKVVLTKNNLQTISSQAFGAFEHVQELDLSYNAIKTVNGDIFGKLRQIRELKLISAFSPELDNGELAALLRQLFLASDNPFTELDTLSMDSNAMVYFPKDLLCKMPALQYLSLRHNRLAAFNVANASCIPVLSTLDLSDNSISRVSESLLPVLDSAFHLQKINFSENPFECDCHLKAFVDWFRRTEQVEDALATTCSDAIPEQFIGLGLGEIDSDQLRCPSDGTPYLHTVYIFVALAVIGLCLLLACLVYANRGLLFGRSKDNSIGKARFRVGGYERLEREPQVDAEFV